MNTMSGYIRRTLSVQKATGMVNRYYFLSPDGCQGEGGDPWMDCFVMQLPV
jgi:hypothetical protein